MNVQVFKQGTPPKSGFAPMLYIPNGTTDVSFYEKAFGAVELRRFGNDDDSIHVSEFMLGEAYFHLHELTPNSTARDPEATGGHTTVEIGLFVDDVHAVVAQAIAAGATLSSPVQDYDYGYRQGNIVDPFGHIWQIQQAI
ncbi:VOC family protein [Mucilaginibacter pedocola]|uniref:Bleomycin resistance protein n=1 Tax=Mucilaginibacter pedocola TaxID=1792845 RepID=A0A1S9PHM0_9SPHI|nr:VOC family protein [Mucilaginibacter pedocola]OOQ60456.1 bleomycin resistance protein [Mucilaginibacter pedocola]